MKKILPLILCLALVLGCISGCAAEDTPYVPHGGALAPEDADVNAWDEEEEEVEQATLSGVADRPYCKGRNYDPSRYASHNTEE